MLFCIVCQMLYVNLLQYLTLTMFGKVLQYILMMCISIFDI